MDFEQIKESSLVVKNTPLPGYIFPNILHLLAQNRFHISLRYLPRFIYSLTLSSVMTPFYIKERLQYDSHINKTSLSKHPVFIVGHWRSGTTYLHNILSHDSNFGYISTFQAYLPGIFLTSEPLFKPLVSASIPKQRPMDDVEMNADFPQEDQYAIGAFSPFSYYHGWCFPQNMEFYNNYVCMDNVSQHNIDAWKQIYLYIIKKITLQQNGKQLVLKNQDNTGKIKLLLELFPDAKFIFLYRNPYTLYCSMMKFIRITLPRFCIQNPPEIEDVEQIMMQLYIRMIQKYLNERSNIPPGNLVEVRYEDFISRPMAQMSNIYAQLKLDGFPKVKSAFQEYLASQDTIKVGQYVLTEDVKGKVEKAWRFAIQEFGY